MVVRGKSRKSDLTSEELKSQIVAVARKHFAMHGFNGASLKEIAREAKVAGSLINYHFKDKRGFFAIVPRVSPGAAWRSFTGFWASPVTGRSFVCGSSSSPTR
ncbi:MAG: TetR/AcrR family transcriptional regulator [Calothrix sp. SM1_5_4]|nr:TetR/AcrR family transcriptional regulator [Calothrix sp. SM1_5_4]